MIRFTCLILWLAGLVLTASAQGKRRPVATPTPVAGIGITPRPMGQTSANAPAPDLSKLPPKIYRLAGKLTAIHREINTLEVEHEAIPDYMEAMTMKFPVKDPKLIKGLKVGDVIQARLHVSQNSGAWWLSDIRRQRK